MQPVKLKVKCTHCKEPNILAIPDTMLGKESLRKCQYCGQMFPFTAPTAQKLQQLMQAHSAPAAPTKPANEEQEFRTTINPNFGRTEKILVLECLANEFTQNQRFEVSQPYMSIGRLSYEQGSYKADIAIETSDVYMSRKHGVLKRHTNNFFSVADLGSANGTFLNNVKLEPSEELIVKDGDTIRMGKTTIRISIK